MKRQASALESIETSTQGIGESFLSYITKSKKWQDDYIEDSRRWKTEIIDAIYQDHSRFEKIQIDRKDERQRKLLAKLIARLEFPEMEDRHRRIYEAYENTFNWIFSQTEPQKPGGVPWVGFTKWLESGNSLYWMTGKAGSGKSTLMKYVYGDPRTMESLRVWALDSNLSTAAYFFWNSGTNIQMSQRGLLLSILHQILSTFPELGTRILPQRWETCYLFGDDYHPLGDTELRQAFKHLKKEDPQAFKFCFFIDGLDEFEGDHAGLVSFMKDISDCENIKVCVSSRPWLVFEDAFKRKPNLMVQDLTYPDILHFTKSTFSGNPGFVELQQREPEYSTTLLEDIAHKSAGVFLWVNLVVHSLLAGFANGDRVSDLQRRLSFLPPDLENLYQKILDNLDPFYLEHASHLFHLVRVAETSLSIFCLSLADEDSDFIIRSEVGPLSNEDMSTRIDVMRRRLNSRCKGLLEVTPEATQSNRGEDLAVDSPKVFRGPNATVQYLHRTVKDFLETPKIWSWLSASRTCRCDPYLSLTKAFLGQLKFNPERELKSDDVASRNTIAEAISDCLFYAMRVEQYSDETLVALLDSLDQTAAQLSAKSSQKDVKESGTYLSKFQNSQNISEHSRLEFLNEPHWVRKLCETGNDPGGCTLLSLAAKLNIYAYVNAKANQGCLVQQDTGIRSLLMDAIVPTAQNRLPKPPGPFPNKRMVQLLLEKGADPNQSMEKILVGKNPSIKLSLLTPWEYVLAQQCDDPQEDHWLDIASIFLKFNASLDPIRALKWPKPRVPRIGYVLSEILGSEDESGWPKWTWSNSRVADTKKRDTNQLLKSLAIYQKEKKEKKELYRQWSQ